MKAFLSLAILASIFGFFTFTAFADQIAAPSFLLTALN
jgi:hypothetical protein